MWHPHGIIRFDSQSSGLKTNLACLPKVPPLSPNRVPHSHLKFEEKGRRERCLVLPPWRSTAWHMSMWLCLGRKAPGAASGEVLAKLSSISPWSLCASLLLKCDKMTGPPKFLPFLQAKESQWNKSTQCPKLAWSSWTLCDFGGFCHLSEPLKWGWCH